MREPRVIWILEKHKVGARGWEICFGLYSTASTKEEGKRRAKRFTEESVGYKFRAVPFVEVKKDKVTRDFKAKLPTECPGCGAYPGMELCHCRPGCNCERCERRRNVRK